MPYSGLRDRSILQSETARIRLAKLTSQTRIGCNRSIRRWAMFAVDDIKTSATDPFSSKSSECTYAQQLRDFDPTRTRTLAAMLCQLLKPAPCGLITFSLKLE
jgi:hypothetical protein